MSRPATGRETVTARLTPTEATALLAYIDRIDANVDREGEEMIALMGDDDEVDADQVWDHLSSSRMPDDLYEPLRKASQHLPADSQVSVTLDRLDADRLLSNTLQLMRWGSFPKLGAVEAVVLSALEEIHHVVKPLEDLPDYWLGRGAAGGA